jgi:hypothetical protein
MNKKGMTLVEVIVAFALTLIVIIFLLSLSLTIKRLYDKDYVRANILLLKSNIAQMINSDLENTNLSMNVTFEPTVDYLDTCTKIKDVTKNYEQKLCFNKTGDVDTLSYNDYKFKLPKGFALGNVTVTREENFMFINIPISYEEEDYTIKVAKILS